MSIDGEISGDAKGDAHAAISVRGVGKRYDIYERNADKIKHLLSLGTKHYGRPFWALRNASFEVQRGQAVGIIGRNGSGKSTLMQIIAGTLSPTEGEVHIRGRVSALLELGSGFNPQFTGRENVYMAGTILGLSRREMDEKFDAIASFADIGEFLDQPIEVYSSGMHARLAFAVAVCVQPDILIVDEILSVGDAGFQQRCISRMRQMLDNGATLLFVSHSAEMVKSICSHALFLNKGQQMYFGPSVEAVDRYMHMLRTETTEQAVQAVATRKPQLAEPAGDIGEAERAGEGLRYGTGHAAIESVRLMDEQGRASDTFKFGEKITLEIVLHAGVNINRIDVMFCVRDKAGVELFGSTLTDSKARIGRMREGERLRARVTFENVLAAGPHGISLTAVRRPDHVGEGLITLDHMDAAAAFESISDTRLVRSVRGKVHVPFEAAIETIAPERVSTP